jgi:hypothetical protein
MSAGENPKPAIILAVFGFNQVESAKGFDQFDRIRGSLRLICLMARLTVKLQLASTQGCAAATAPIAQNSRRSTTPHAAVVFAATYRMVLKTCSHDRIWEINGC